MDLSSNSPGDTVYQPGLFSTFRIRRLAITEADAFFDFMTEGDCKAQTTGLELYHAGVGDAATLRIGQVLRQFCTAYGGDDVPTKCLEDVEAYHRAVVQGYFRAREANILEEQERIRSALQHTLHRYTLQIETAAEVARAAISTLDLGVLLTTAVDLIGERFGLDYVGIYLLDAEKRFAVLRAATGPEGRRRMARDHRLKLNGASTISRCIMDRRHLLVSGPTEDSAAPETSWIPGTHSEVALPLITRDVVIGALSAQSHRAGAFSSQDVPGFQIMADQLASAIENARLYADARHQADDLALAYEQLKELERLKDQFMQNVSHELRTPLTMIRGYAELLLMSADDNADPEQREALQVILRNSEALTELVADILSIMEVSASKTTSTSVSMLEVVQGQSGEFPVCGQAKRRRTGAGDPIRQRPVSDHGPARSSASNRGQPHQQRDQIHPGQRARQCPASGKTPAGYSSRSQTAALASPRSIRSASSSAFSRWTAQDSAASAAPAWAWLWSKNWSRAMEDACRQPVPVLTRGARFQSPCR